MRPRLHNLKDRFKFHLEVWLLRGPVYRLAVISGFVVAASVAAGLVVHGTGSDFDSPGAAVWWAFLRFTDPGYLGDDEGLLKRAVSLGLTLGGYVVFLGAIVAIMTQWLVQTLRHLELGLTPIFRKGHIVIIGWTSRTPNLLDEILGSEGRLDRFLKLRGLPRLHVAVLAEEVTGDLVAEIREALGPRYRPRSITLRSGTPLRLEHLRRVDFAHAAAIVVPAHVFGNEDPSEADTLTMKTLMSVDHAIGVENPDHPPNLVAELLDSRELPVVRGTYRGPLDLVSSDLTMSRILIQSFRHPGVAGAFDLLLGRGECQIFVREAEELAGTPFAGLSSVLPAAIPIGLVRPEGGGFVPMMCPAPDEELRAGDRIVAISRRFEDVRPTGHATSAAASTGGTEQAPPPRRRRLLVLGWNHRLPTLIRELKNFRHESFELVMASKVPIEKRTVEDAANVTLVHHEMDYVLAGRLDQLDLGGFDSILLMASDRADTGEEADARVARAYLQLRRLLPSPAPRVIVELVSSADRALFSGPAVDVVVTSALVSHMMAQITLRRELSAVYEELFGAGGAELLLRPRTDYPGSSFADVRLAAAEAGEIAIGLRTQEQTRLLPDNDAPLPADEGTSIIVVGRFRR